MNNLKFTLHYLKTFYIDYRNAFNRIKLFTVIISISWLLDTNLRLLLNVI